MAQQSVKIADDLIAILRDDAERESRSLAGQVEHYIRIGRAIARSPDYDHHRVEDALSGGMEIHELSLEEQEAFFAEFASLMEKQGGSHRYWEDRQQRGLGVGTLADGTLVRQLPGGQTVAL